MVDLNRLVPPVSTEWVKLHCQRYLKLKKSREFANQRGHVSFHIEKGLMIPVYKCVFQLPDVPGLLKIQNSQTRTGISLSIV